MTEKEFYNDVNFIRQKVLVKFPALGVYMVKSKYHAANCQTAGTDGKDIYITPSFWNKLNDNEKVFLMGHEILHIASNHTMRSKGRDKEVWNIATDSVVNQILISQNLTMIKGGVDLAEAIGKSADEMYDKLIKEKGKKLEEFDKNYCENNKTGSDEKDNNIGSDSHDMWPEAVRQVEQEAQKQNEKKSTAQKIKDMLSRKQDDIQKKQPEQEVQDDSEFEKTFVEKNNDLKKQIAKQVKEKLERDVDQIKSDYEYTMARNIGKVGYTNNPVSWKTLLKRKFEKEETRWSDRRADESNDWMSRVEDIDEFDDVETEVFIDVSGSVSNEKVREFLRQLKPLLKESKLKVGCFDTYIYPFVEVKTEEEIDNFKIQGRAPQHEDFDAAVKSFSKKKDVNKIIFTDGKQTLTVPSKETEGINVIWIVYGNNMNFTPVCGKVIEMQENEFESMVTKDSEFEMSF